MPDAVEAGVLGAHADVDHLVEGETVAAQKQADARRVVAICPCLGHDDLNPSSARRM